MSLHTSSHTSSTESEEHKLGSCRRYSAGSLITSNRLMRMLSGEELTEKEEGISKPRDKYTFRRWSTPLNLDMIDREFGADELNCFGPGGFSQTPALEVMAPRTDRLYSSRNNPNPHPFKQYNLGESNDENVILSNESSSSSVCEIESIVETNSEKGLAPLPKASSSLTTKLEPVMSHHASSEPTISGIGTSNVKETLREEDAAEVARLCFEGNEKFVSRRQLAEFLGKDKKINSLILQHYMSLLDFKDKDLNMAFRDLCSRLYVKAETQQIDRILKVFADRYQECNPKNIFNSAEVVHAVSYSLLLLNTDLHIAQVPRKMTRSQFVRNTLEVVQVVDPSVNTSKLEPVLRDLYTSVRLSRVEQPANCSPELGKSGSEKRTTRWGKDMFTRIWPNTAQLPSQVPPEYDSGSRPGTPGIAEDAKRTALMGSLQAGFASAIALETHSSSSIENGSMLDVSSFGSPLRHNTLTDEDTISTQSSISSHLLSVCTQPSVMPHIGAPYVKEGVLIRKHLLEKQGVRAKHREWQECFVVVDRGRLMMFRFDKYGSSSHTKLCRRSRPLTMWMREASSSELLSKRHSVVEKETSENKPEIAQVFGGGNWMTNAIPIGELSLRHTIAKALPAGYSRTRNNVFALTLPNGGTYLFQAGTQQHVLEWCRTCTYWAARESRPPLLGGVSSIEYGWNSIVLKSENNEDNSSLCPPETQQPQSRRASFVGMFGDAHREKNTKPTVQEWQPPLAPTQASPHSFDEAEQLQALQQYIANLEKELEDHTNYREPLQTLYPPKSTNYSRAISNWERKSQYLLHELVKYQEYAESLAKSIEFQAEMKQEKTN
ncbi:uncharacterized protein VTP21DRAFT_4145 [Calcarisporiella thermophila]|uniref:uncharacterized protein n=1 Tax=Calcarisporiella thermophila TaxID=911321 RepID=UPI003743C630